MNYLKFHGGTKLPPIFVTTAPSRLLSTHQDGRPDVTYFSEDCFHFSERGHADMAVAMWNNMVSEVTPDTSGKGS